MTVQQSAETVHLARYNTDGTLDTTFGSGGKVTTKGGDLSALSVRYNGRILAVATSCCSAPILLDLIRYLPAEPSMRASVPTGSCSRRPRSVSCSPAA